MLNWSLKEKKTLKTKLILERLFQEFSDSIRIKKTIHRHSLGNGYYCAKWAWRQEFKS